VLIHTPIPGERTRFPPTVMRFVELEAVYTSLGSADTDVRQDDWSCACQWTACGRPARTRDIQRISSARLHLLLAECPSRRYYSYQYLLALGVPSQKLEVLPSLPGPGRINTPWRIGGKYFMFRRCDHGRARGRKLSDAYKYDPLPEMVAPPDLSWQDALGGHRPGRSRTGAGGLHDDFAREFTSTTRRQPSAGQPLRKRSRTLSFSALVIWCRNGGEVGPWCTR